jgi:hypothetical protein
MWNSRLLLLLIFVLPLMGCGGGPEDGRVEGEAPPSQEELDKPSSKADLKTKLNEIAESGVGGSALSGVQPFIDEVKSTDAALAASLSKDFQALSQMSDPAKIKVAAKKMADKL